MTTKTESETKQWGKISLSPDETFSFHCGEIAISGLCENDELSLVAKVREEEKDPTRWALPKNDHDLVVAPALPDLPVLVEPESPFQVLPGASARVFLAIPVTVVLRASQSKAVLEQIASSVLSQTWFGELDSGDLCYRLPTALSREPFPDHREDRITSPVEIRNDASEALPVTRLCLRVSHLPIYQSDDGLWTSETEVRFQGGNKSSRIEIQKGPPNEAPNADLVGEAQEKGPVTKVGRSFRSLRKWTREFLDPEP